MSDDAGLYSSRQVAEIFGVSRRTILRLVGEGLVCPVQERGRRRFSDADLERIRTVLVLSRDLGVNLAGVEVILHLREQLVTLHHQAEAILGHLHQEMAASLRGEMATRDPECPDRAPGS
ncbi:MAG: MerR family transcriptional regulator [Thermodesulfobacteriota bacterium]